MPTHFYRPVFAILISISALTACETSPRVDPEGTPYIVDDNVPPMPQAPTEPPPQRESEPLALNLDELETKLEMTRDRETLGFREKSFNTCTLGIHRQKCQILFLGILNFRAQCRDTEGTVESVDAWALSPLVDNALEWRVGRATGMTATDGDGYGQIRFVSTASTKNQRLILISPPNSLGLRMSDVTKLILPRDWCY